jgi:hypothetical protein
VDKKYNPQVLNEALASQIQSPDNSVLYYSNLNFLRKEELILLAFVLWTNPNEIFRKVVIADLLDHKKQFRDLLGNELAEVAFERFLTRQVLQGKPWYKLEREVFFATVKSERGLLSLLSDHQIGRSLERRLKVKLYFPSKARRAERHRGYRDHGSARPAHCWTERNWHNLTPTWKKEMIHNIETNWPKEKMNLIEIKPIHFYLLMTG